MKKLETRKALRARIAALEEQLEGARRRAARIEKPDLPKCKSLACYNCKHIVYLESRETGAIYLLGCGKDFECKDFEHKGGPPEWNEETEVLMAKEEKELLLPVKRTNQGAAAPPPPCLDE